MTNELDYDYRHVDNSNHMSSAAIFWKRDKIALKQIKTKSY